MNVYHNSFYAMGSRFNAVLPFDDNEICEKLFYLIKNEVIRIERKLSYFDKYSEVSRINTEAAKNPVGLDDELFLILKKCIEYTNITGGAFDITLRPVIEKYSGGINEPVQSYANDLELDVENRTIFFNSEKVKIDFGAYGKGYALEKVKEILDNSPVKHAFLSFGESSIYANGKHPGGKKWQVGIKDLEDTGKSLHVFELENESVSSSSNYYADDSGQVHKKINIINPFTLSPADDLCIMSVKTSSPAEAEIFSTAFFILDDARVEEIITGFKNVEAVRIRFTGDMPVIKHFKQD